MALSTSTNGNIASQANTQSPQLSAGSGLPPAAAAKSVQPGTANSLLTNQNVGDGISLRGTILPVANLNTSAHMVSSQPRTTLTKSQHHLNGAWLTALAVLVVLAVITFWLARRSVKNTTHY